MDIREYRLARLTEQLRELKKIRELLETVRDRDNENTDGYFEKLISQIIDVEGALSSCELDTHLEKAEGE